MAEVWIGLANVVPRPGNEDLDGAAGAYVNVIASAETHDEFERIVIEQLQGDGFDVLHIDDAELFHMRIQRHSVEPMLHSQLASVRNIGGLGLGTFHAYDVDDASH